MHTAGKRYFYEIDGLRFYAFLLILINHTGLSKFVEGHTFFFTLSGFLIGLTTFNDIYTNGLFSLRNYIIKRVLRTFPLYYFIVFSCGIAYLICKFLGIHFSFDNYWSFLLFVQNYFGYGTIFILTNLWAMAVTEQLYFAWGIVAYRKQQKMIDFVAILAVLFIAGAFIVRYVWKVHYANTLNYAGPYLLGAYFGRLFFVPNKLIAFLKHLEKHKLLLLFSIAIGIIIFGFSLSFVTKTLMLRILLLSFGFCLIVLLLCLTKLSGNIIFVHPVIRYLGKISFGLYCYHPIGLALIPMLFRRLHLPLDNKLLFFLVLLSTILAAIVSYELFEKKLMTMKSGFLKYPRNISIT